MMREQIAPVTNSGAPAGYLIFRKQRSCRTVLFVVPDSVYIDVLHGAQVREVAVLAVNDAARRDAAVRVDYHRTIEVEARAWLIGLAKLLLGMVTVTSSLNPIVSDAHLALASAILAIVVADAVMVRYLTIRLADLRQ